MKQKMEKMQVLNDGADEEDFNELLKILRSFGEVEVLYDPSNPKDKDVTADEVIERYDNFKKMETMQVLNDGADEEDFKQLLEILKGFGQVEVLYDPSDPKDKDVTAVS